MGHRSRLRGHPAVGTVTAMDDTGRDFHPWVPEHDTCSFWERMGYPLCITLFAVFGMSAGYALARFICCIG